MKKWESRNCILVNVLYVPEEGIQLSFSMDCLDFVSRSKLYLGHLMILQKMIETMKGRKKQRVGWLVWLSGKNETSFSRGATPRFFFAEVNTILGRMQQQATCPTCRGTGEVVPP